MNNLLFDFTVDKSTNTVFVTENLMQNFIGLGCIYQNKKFLTNGGHPKPWKSKTKNMTLK
jgi:hypothetical protein